VLLSRVDLDRLRALPERTCFVCSGRLYHDYCREHDEFFERGHVDGCAQASGHETHRTYTGFEATVETGPVELAAAYAAEAEGLSIGVDDLG
jgi:hypothetical protein